MTTPKMTRFVQGEMPNFTQGERMAKIRNDADVRREQMARMLDVSLGTISNWEHDRNPPPKAALLVYAELRPDIDRKTMVRWIMSGDVIDLSDQDSRDLWCNTVEQLDLFSLTPQAADVRSGGAVWEFSDRSSVGTSRNAADVANGLVRQLVA